MSASIVFKDSCQHLHSPQDSSSSSICVADARFVACGSSSILVRSKAFCASASARRIASRLVRFTPDTRRGFLCRLQCRQSFCVVLTGGHRVRHVHQCPEVVSLTRQTSMCLVPSEEVLVLCIPQSANLCGIEHFDTSCTQVFANRLAS